MPLIANDRLREYLDKHVRTGLDFSIGEPISMVNAVVASAETAGAVLFADVSGFSRRVTGFDPVEASVYAAHFYAAVEDALAKRMDGAGGIVDKFIGDEVMMVFPQDEVNGDPLDVALGTARAFLEHDPFSFEPKVGIAEGPFAISLVGTSTTGTISAMGHAVNLAARCTKGLRPHSLRVATDREDVVRRVFAGQRWKVARPWVRFRPKHMPPVRTFVVIGRAGFRWGPPFNYEEWIARYAREARALGAAVQVKRP